MDRDIHRILVSCMLETKQRGINNPNSIIVMEDLSDNDDYLHTFKKRHGLDDIDDAEMRSLIILIKRETPDIHMKCLGALMSHLYSKYCNNLDRVLNTRWSKPYTRLIRMYERSNNR